MVTKKTVPKKAAPKKKTTRGGKRPGAGAPKGSQNARKSRKAWTDAIHQAIADRASRGRISTDDMLAKLAGKLIDAALGGDLHALKEIGDRIEGRVTQTIAGDPEHPVHVSGITVKLV